MKNIAITIFTILIIITLGLYLISFQVRETESCLIMTFGKASTPITEPGWKLKWPYPIQKPVKYDSRMKVYASETEETTTSGGEPIIVETYVVWKIADPLLYYNATSEVSDFEGDSLNSQIRNVQNSVIGRHDFSEFVNSDEDKIAFESIEEEMLSELRDSVTDADFGIEIKTLGIKKLKISEDVSTKVFDRMRAERNRRAQDTISEGKTEADSIEQDRITISDTILAAAEARAKIIRGKGDAEAAQYYEQLNEDPELAEFLYVMDMIPEMLKDRTTIVIDTTKEPFDVLWNKPNLTPASAEPNEPVNINSTEEVEE
ncbi:MAG: protease modulator HflC [Sedimentisphaerales bacterium]|nr:protease modulator HflC [Sedimentisphaerales bacterium]